MKSLLSGVRIPKAMICLFFGLEKEPGLRVQGSPLTCSFVGGLRRDVTQGLPGDKGMSRKVEGPVLNLSSGPSKKEPPEHNSSLAN